MKGIFVAVFILLSLALEGQSLQVAQNYSDRSDYRHAVPLYEKIINEAKLNQNLDLQVTAQNGLADCYMDLGATYKAMAILKQNIVLLNKAPNKNYLLLAKTHQLLANCYDKLYLIEDYLTETNIFYQYYKKAAPDKEIYKALYYAYIGRYYNMRIIIEKAFAFTNAALKIYHKHLDEKEVDPYIFYNAHLFTIRNRPKERKYKYVYRDSLNFLFNKRYPHNNAKKARLYVSLAALDLDEAAGLINPKLLNKTKSFYHANCAIDYYNKALQMNDRFIGYFSSNSAYLNSLKGLMYFYKKEYKTALENYDIGIKRLTLSPYVFTNNNVVLFDLLKWKAWCLDEMYSQNNSPKLLYEIEKTLNLQEKYWLQYANYVFKNKERFNTHNYIDSPYNDIALNYFKLYRATRKKNYLDLYFEYDEKSKYSGLLENLYKERIVQTSDVSDTIIIKTYESFDNLLLETNNKISINKGTKIKFEMHYKNFISNQNQIDLFNKKKLVSLKEVQKKLKENEAILSYKVNSSQSHYIPFVLVISKDIVKVVKFQDLSNTSEKEKKLFNIVEKLNQNTLSEYKKEAFDYYQSYFKPIERYLPKKNTHIRIIPSISFGNFPFELLLSSPSESNDFSKMPYLIKKYQFSYGLSSSISNIVDKNVSKSPAFSIFSPSFSSKVLSELKESNGESKRLANSYNAQLIQGKEATKKTFQKHLERDQIVALLSHGSATIDEIETNKGIYLSDGFLSLNEVYNLKAHCDFLLLGACETGVGYKSREGNINLARAFTAIGVKSMMLASWKIDEKSSAQIISSFLKYLDSGCTKSEALQKAKLDYLATASPRMANPLYWAGLNITGNNETIPLHQRNYWWWGFFVFSGVFTLFIVLRYTKIRIELRRD